MSWSTRLSLTMGLIILLVASISILQLPSNILTVIGVGIGFSVVIFALAVVTYFCLIGWQKLQQERNVTRASSYQLHTDGLGQSFVIRNGQIISLTTNPKWQIADNREPTQAELAMQALFFQSAGKAGRHVEETTQQLLLPPPSPELMPILDNAQRVLIKAASDGGKTTLLQHIADRRVKSQSVLIIDSQSYPDKWPGGCKVVGTGSNHQAISTALDNLIEIMVQRYREIGQGLVKEGAHPKLTIIIDEWMAIVSECSNASDVIRRLLTESRKAAFSVFIGSHSERVKALGLDGRGDLRDGFLIVRIEIENGQRVATYDQGRGEMPCLLPGQFVQAQASSPFEIEAIEQPVMTDEENDIIEMVNRGESYKVISQAVWGIGKFGKFYNAKIEATCRKYGVEVRNF